MSFKSYGLHETLKQLMTERNTGTLSCSIKGYEKQLFIKDGIACFASSTDPDDKLPNVLIRQGRFTEEQFENAEANFNESISVGRNLVEMGLITQQELVAGAKEQVYSIFARCMHAETGSESFEEGVLPNGIVSLPLKYPQAFLRAILSMDDKNWVSSRFGGALSFIPKPTDKKKLDLSGMELGDFAEPLYELIDGETNFNHLAFEADVDDFLLLKFLYALKLLDYISIEKEDDEEVPEVDDVLDDLSHAMEEREELERLKDSSLKGVSMDETVALSMSKATEMGGSMDVTMEISRDALSNNGAFSMDETGEIPRPDGYEENQDEEGEGEEEDDPDATAAAFEAAFAETGEEEDDDETGLDDLNDMSSDDIFAEEMARMEAPLESTISSDVIMPDQEDHPEDEEFEEPTDRPAKPKQAHRRALLVAALGLILASILIFTRPMIEKQFNPLSPLLEDEAKKIADHEVIDKTSEPPKEEDPSQAENQASDAPLDSQTPDTNQTQSVTPESDTKPPVKAVEDPLPEITKPVVQKAPVEEQTKEGTLDPPTSSTDLPTAATIATPPSDETPTNATVSDDPFRSPIAEGWDPKTRRPRGRLQAAVDLPPIITNPASSLQKGTQAQAPTKTYAREKPKQAAFVENEPPKKAPTITTQPPRRETKPINTGSAEKALSLLEAHEYDRAASMWQELHSQEGEKYTLAIFLDCDPANVEKARQEAGKSSRFFVLPKVQNGRTCYWVCWGTFGAPIGAKAERRNLPSALTEKVEIRKLSSLFN